MLALFLLSLQRLFQACSGLQGTVCRFLLVMPLSQSSSQGIPHDTEKGTDQRYNTYQIDGDWIFRAILCSELNSIQIRNIRGVESRLYSIFVQVVPGNWKTAYLNNRKPRVVCKPLSFPRHLAHEDLAIQMTCYQRNRPIYMVSLISQILAT